MDLGGLSFAEVTAGEAWLMFSYHAGVMQRLKQKRESGGDEANSTYHYGGDEEGRPLWPGGVKPRMVSHRKAR